MSVNLPQQFFSIQLQPIGVVHNRFPEPTSPEEIRAKPSKIVLDPDLMAGLEGLDPGMEIMIIFYFHHEQDFNHTLLQHPRGDKNRPQRGVFSLRSPLRPNPIGVSKVELVSIEENVLTVRGLDAIDGSPVLDIKPS